MAPEGVSHAAVIAVLTDLDGVLVDSGRLIEDVWRAWSTRHDLDPAVLLATMHGRLARQVIEEYAPWLDADAETTEMDATERARSSELSAVPGAMSCIDVARQHRWAIVTSGVRGLALSRIESVGIPTPEVLVTADDVSRGKPDPEPYLLAATRLGVSPGQCVVVEDAPAGVAAGKAAGMVVLAVETTHVAEDLTQADAVFNSMHGVRDELVRLLGRRR